MPQTGQTSVYTDGDDGDIMAGVPWPNPRFVSGTGTEADCIIDKLTGLMWPKNGSRVPLSWANSVYYSSINYCGHTDWRLPNIVELKSLINKEEPNTAAWLNTQGFNNVQPSYHWSSTTYYSEDYAWGIDMGNGFASSDWKADQNNWWPVRTFGSSAVAMPRTGQVTSYYSGDDGAIKAGVAWPSPRFTVTYCNASGPCTSQTADCDAVAATDIVTDNLTGLIWPMNADHGYTYWQGAIDIANNLTLCGQTDWRLPNVNELISLVDYSNYTPALPDSLPFINVHSSIDRGRYWSSSTGASYTDQAWNVDIWNGGMIYWSKSANFYVWPVRGGQIGSLVIPVAPSNLSAKATSGTNVVLNWKDNSDNEKEFRIYRIADDGSPQLVTTTAAAAKTASDTTATNNAFLSTYKYYVLACNSAGCSPATRTAIVPFRPTALKATVISANQINLRWTDNSGNEKGFEVWEKEGACATVAPWSKITTLAANASSYSVKGLTSTSPYSYKVRAYTRSTQTPYAFGYSIFSACVSKITP